MPEITVRINNRHYKLACAEGQEERLSRLATYLDQKVSELAKATPATPPPSESQLLVIASLTIADELGEAYDELQALRSGAPEASKAGEQATQAARNAVERADAKLAEAQQNQERLVKAISALAERIEAMATRLEAA